MIVIVVVVVSDCDKHCIHGPAGVCALPDSHHGPVVWPQARPALGGGLHSSGPSGGRRHRLCACYCSRGVHGHCRVWHAICQVWIEKKKPIKDNLVKMFLLWWKKCVKFAVCAVMYVVCTKINCPWHLKVQPDILSKVGLKLMHLPKWVMLLEYLLIK